MAKSCLSKNVFKNFPDYWHYARHLSKGQRRVVFNSLSPEQQDSLTKSYNIGRWDELFFRNDINDKADSLKKEFGYDLFFIRAKVFSNKSVYVPKRFWEIVEKEFKKYEDNANFVIGGINSFVCDSNDKVVLLVRDYENDDEEEDTKEE
ncbi:MAG: hypothetical protein J7L15_08955 [Clostridiales bacterium]|nr:hypothetical protein [Clostridiales bacterium]